MNLYDRFVNFVIGRINWTGVKYLMTGREYNLTDDDIDQVYKLLIDHRCIVLTRRNTHLTTYLIGLSDFFLRLRRSRSMYPLKMGYWAHIFTELSTGHELKIVESIGKGVVKSNFYRALNVDSICVLKPKYLSEEEMETANELAVKYIGALYDTCFNINDDSRLSCAELVYRSLSRTKPYGIPGLNTMIRRLGNLTPQMFYDCGDFEILLEIRR